MSAPRRQIAETCMHNNHMPHAANTHMCISLFVSPVATRSKGGREALQHMLLHAACRLLPASATHHESEQSAHATNCKLCACIRCAMHEQTNTPTYGNAWTSKLQTQHAHACIGRASNAERALNIELCHERGLKSIEHRICYICTPRLLKNLQSKSP